MSARDRLPAVVRFLPDVLGEGGVSTSAYVGLWYPVALMSLVFETCQAFPCWCQWSSKTASSLNVFQESVKFSCNKSKYFKPCESGKIKVCRYSEKTILTNFLLMKQVQ